MSYRPKDPDILSDPLAKAWRRGELPVGSAMTKQRDSEQPIYVQFSTIYASGEETIRKWSRDPFEGAAKFVLADTIESLTAKLSETQQEVERQQSRIEELEAAVRQGADWFEEYAAHHQQLVEAAGYQRAILQSQDHGREE